MIRKKLFTMAVTAAAAIGLFAGSAVGQASVTSTHTFFDLATDNNQSYNNNQTYGVLKINLGPQGNASVITSNGSRALSLSGRLKATDQACQPDWGDCSWQGLDIIIREMRASGQFVSGKYTIEVAGYIPTGTTVPGDTWMAILEASDDVGVYDELVYANVKNVGDEFELKYESFPLRGSQVSSLANDGFVYRIQTRNGSGMSFVITKLVVKVDPVENEDDFVEWPTPAWQDTCKSMKDKFESAFKIGNIMTPGNKVTQLDHTSSADFFKKHYNAVTLENDMKPDKTMPNKGSLGNLTDADKVVKWAKDNNIDVIGHTLVWHSQSPDWLNKKSDGSPLTRAEAKANMELFINAVVEHYKGKGVVSWDVVNEAFMNVGECFGRDGETDHDNAEFDPSKHWSTALRSSPCHKQRDNIPVNEHTNSNLSPWYDAYANGADASKGESGADYLYDAFVLTRLADPDAVLYYNDYNEEFPLKREAIAQMVEEYNEKWKTDDRNRWQGRLLIEGIGMQSHYYGGPNPPYETATYDFSKIEPTIERFAKTGARISITELDIPMGGWNHKYNRAKLLPEEEELQASQYAQLMRLYLKYRNYIERVTFWGMADAVSWRKSGMPLLFDNSLRPKAAYDSIMAINISSIPAAVVDVNTGAVNRGSKLSSVRPAPLVSVRGRTLSIKGAPDVKVRVRIVNMKGKTVKKYNLKGGSDVSLRRLPAGVYMIEAVRTADKFKDSSRVTLK